MASILRPENRTISRAHHSKTVKYLQVEKAVYAGDYKVRVSFNDATEQVVDFAPFLTANPHPQYSKYLNLELFRTFAIEMGNLVWGNDWDLIFPVEQLYLGEIS